MFTDLFFIVFFASQELMDSSNIHMMNMKSIYQESTLNGALFFSKVIVTSFLIAITYIIASKFITVYEGHAVAVMVIYFICAYEFIFNVLITLTKILQLDPVQNPSSWIWVYDIKRKYIWKLISNTLMIVVQIIDHIYSNFIFSHFIK